MFYTLRFHFWTVFGMEFLGERLSPWRGSVRRDPASDLRHCDTGVLSGNVLRQ